MARMNLVKTTPNATFAAIRNAFTSYAFEPSETFAWSPEQNTIFYPREQSLSKQFFYSLLHEIGHAELSHTLFTSDVDLLRIEREAWNKAEQLSSQFGIELSDEHIEKCMDTYRDWLYARSMCPHCHQCGIQSAKTTYYCPFCTHTWKVSESRLCRVVRRSTAKNSLR